MVEKQIFKIIEVNELIAAPNMAMIEFKHFEDFIDLIHNKGIIYRCLDTLYILSTLDCFVYNMDFNDKIKLVKLSERKG